MSETEKVPCNPRRIIGRRSFLFYLFLIFRFFVWHLSSNALIILGVLFWFLLSFFFLALSLSQRGKNGELEAIQAFFLATWVLTWPRHKFADPLWLIGGEGGRLVDGNIQDVAILFVCKLWSKTTFAIFFSRSNYFPIISFSQNTSFTIPNNFFCIYYFWTFV